MLQETDIASMGDASTLSTLKTERIMPYEISPVIGTYKALTLSNIYAPALVS